MKTHEGSHADLMWGLNVNLSHDHGSLSFTIYNSSIKLETRIVRFHDVFQGILWYNGYEERAETINNESIHQIGIRLNNILHADAQRYILYSDYSWNSDAVIYVFGKFLSS